MKKTNWVKFLSALTLIPIILWVSSLFGGNTLSNDGFATWKAVFVSIIIYVPLFILAIFYWSDGILRQDWKRWAKRWVRNLLWVIASVLFMMLALIPLSKMLTNNLMGNGTGSVFFLKTLPTIIVLIIPLMQAFTEEIIYHHALLVPFRNNKYLYLGMSLISNIIFAFVHINNVSGNISALVLYFVMGMFFQITYETSKRNIWQNILTHLLYNGSITALGIVGLVVSTFVR